MKIRVIRILSILLAALLLVSLAGCKDKKPVEKTFGILDISKHGNVKVNTTFDELKAMDIEIGDIIAVKVGDTECSMPVGSSYSDVDSGSMICRFDSEANEVILAINMGSFATDTGAAVKETISEDPGYRWNAAIDKVTISLLEKGGYLEEYTVRSLTRSLERADYPGLSDEDFANFRAVNVTGIAKNWLYRSSSPLDPVIWRNTYAKAAMENTGIRTVINLSDSKEDAEAFETYPGSAYSACSMFYPEMGYDFTAAEYGEAMKAVVRFMVANEGPYLIHCKEGKDRTGVVCAVFESLMGANYTEVCADYMKTYLNFYGIEAGSETYRIVKERTFDKTLSTLFGVETLSKADLSKEAEEYLLSIGLSADEISAFKAKLSVK